MIASAIVRVELYGGREAVIDAADFDRTFFYEHHGETFAFRICDLSWHSEPGGRRHTRHTTYARATVRRAGVKFSLRMHTLILGKRAGFVIDHDDGNGLNNKRSNLVHRTHAENIRRGWAAGRNRRSTTTS